MEKEVENAYKRRLLFIGFWIIVLFLGGAFFYHNVEKWSWIDSLYFSAATMTTVGYGDLSPKTNEGKIVSIFYLFISVGISFYGLTIFASHFIETREEEWMRRIFEAEKQTKKFQSNIKNIFEKKKNIFEKK